MTVSKLLPLACASSDDSRMGPNPSMAQRVTSRKPTRTARQVAVRPTFKPSLTYHCGGGEKAH